MSKALTVEVQYQPNGVWKYKGTARDSDTGELLSDKLWDWKILEWFQVRWLIREAQKTRNRQWLNERQQSDPDVFKREYRF